MISYLKKDDIIHRSGLVDLIVIIGYQLKTANKYERPKLMAEKAEYERILALMGDRDTIPYGEVENGI